MTCYFLSNMATYMEVWEEEYVHSQWQSDYHFLKPTNNVIATYIQKLQLSIIISAICSYYIVICKLLLGTYLNNSLLFILRMQLSSCFFPRVLLMLVQMLTKWLTEPVDYGLLVTRYTILSSKLCASMCYIVLFLFMQSVIYIDYVNLHPSLKVFLNDSVILKIWIDTKLPNFVFQISLGL